jgi:predicted HicB family RNase H-like nuclease
MTAPDRHKRTVTAIRLTEAAHEQITREAAARDLSVNYLVNRAVEQFLDRLIPVEEMKWTR